jgi:hypothetical protein
MTAKHLGFYFIFLFALAEGLGFCIYKTFLAGLQYGAKAQCEKCTKKSQGNTIQEQGQA